MTCKMTQDHLLQNIIIQQGGAIIGGQMVTVRFQKISTPTLGMVIGNSRGGGGQKATF